MNDFDINLLKPIPLLRSYRMNDIKNEIAKDLYNFNKNKSDEILYKLQNYDLNDVITTIIDNYFIFNDDSLIIFNKLFDTDVIFANNIINKNDSMYDFFMTRIFPRLSINEIRHIKSQLTYPNNYLNHIFQTILDEEKILDTLRINEYLNQTNLDGNIGNIISSYLNPDVMIDQDYGNIEENIEEKLNKKSKSKKKKNKKKKNKKSRGLRRF